MNDSAPYVSDPLYEHFQASIRHVDGRYEVCLPWKTPVSQSQLLDNEKLARTRLVHLDRKLAKDPSLHVGYDRALSVIEDLGVIEEVKVGEVTGPHPVYYMPHRPVVKESSSTTKIRPVFDASARGYNGVSLNDCMEVGPCLITSLVEILIRFRRWRFALVSDITKAFLQISVRKEDRDVHRFLWNKEGVVRTMRFTRVPFGNRSSPFLLNATIKYHLSSFPESRTVQELQDNLYVDNWLSGADGEAEVCDMFVEGRQVMDKASLPLAQWNSNSEVVVDMIYREFEGKFLETGPMKVLGLKWLSSLDCFTFDGIELPPFVPTKRVVLSFIARLFDPLGLLMPFVMLVKILFQEIWRLGVEWDDPLPEPYTEQFRAWVDGTALLKQWKVPRWYGGGPWLSLTGLELHCFGDASPAGYGACAYLRFPTTDGKYTTSFVLSKARVAPIKRVTLPRLELLAALLCARLVSFLIRTLRLSSETRYQCWSDSMVALGWIKGDPARWKTFVANRVTEIQDLTDPSCWSHCSGSENPADLLTRGVGANQLTSSNLWLFGPPWLQSEYEPCDTSCESLVDPVVEVPEEVTSPLLMTVETQSEPVFPVERWSSLCKAVNVVAFVLRFVHNSRVSHKQRRTGSLFYDELTQARVKLFLDVQRDQFKAEYIALTDGTSLPKNSPISMLTPFLGKDGLIRVQGRLQESSLAYEVKHPIILPKCHLSLLLVRFQHSLLKHAGVNSMVSTLRHTYWIIGLRRLAKQVKKECTPCQRFDSRPCNQTFAPLPGVRVKEAPPFSVTGVDHAGPLFCVDRPGKKLYILLLTCAVVRAVHLELVDSLSLSDFMLALRRFVARRGLPSVTFFSDNAKTFVSAKSQLGKVYGPTSPDWRFIAPLSPWWGGWWERMVRSVKSALRKSVGKNVLTRCELETSLHEVEACVNSRPLTLVSDDIQSSVPLTPSHFLSGRVAASSPDVTFDWDADDITVTAKDLQTRECSRQAMLNKFWSIWSSDYLLNLPHAVKGFHSNMNLREGSVVLVREDGVPRMKWPMGVVTKLLVGRDSKIRACEIRAKGKTIVRSVQRLHDLEVLAEHSGMPEQEPVIPPSLFDLPKDVKSSPEHRLTTSRSGRVMKPRKLFKM